MDFNPEEEKAEQNEHYAEYPTLPNAWIYIAIDIRHMNISKVGLTTAEHPAIRLSQGTTYNPFLKLFSTYELSKCTYGMSQKELNDIEGYIHRRSIFGDPLKHLVSKRNTEWFLMDPESVEIQVDWLFAKRGFSVDGYYLFTYFEGVETYGDVVIERMKKIKRWVPNQLGEGKSSYFRIWFLLFAFFPLLMILPSILSEKNAENDKNKTLLSELNRLDSLRTVDSLTNPIETILSIEKFKTEQLITESQETNFFSKKNWGKILVGCILVSFVLFWLFMVKYYPAYNFCWGDYLEIFERKESIRKTVFVVIIIGIVVSTIGGVIANYTGIGK